MKESYQEWNPGDLSLQLVNAINLILVEYEEQGYRLTLRQLYYQIVSHDLFPENRKWSWTGSKWTRDPQGTKNAPPNYKWLGGIVSRGRLAGFIDWEMIEDRVRVPQSRAHWASPKEIIEAAAQSYYRSRWANQEHYVEVWCEKDAVSNILQPVCRRFDVTFMANRGYSSQTAMYEASSRLYAANQAGKHLEVIYFGDHDPSGIDMTRDIKDRLGIFLNNGRPFTLVYRAALNMDQVKKYRPPENPAKVTDPRFKDYVTVWGDKSWELDALEPKVLARLVEDRIKLFIDQDLWDEVEEEEANHQEALMKTANEWGK